MPPKVYQRNISWFESVVWCDVSGYVWCPYVLGAIFYQCLNPFPLRNHTHLHAQRHDQCIASRKCWQPTWSIFTTNEKILLSIFSPRMSDFHHCIVSNFILCVRCVDMYTHTHTLTICTMAASECMSIIHYSAQSSRLQDAVCILYALNANDGYYCDFIIVVALWLLFNAKLHRSREQEHSHIHSKRCNGYSHLCALVRVCARVCVMTNDDAIPSKSEMLVSRFCAFHYTYIFYNILKCHSLALCIC